MRRGDHLLLEVVLDTLLTHDKDLMLHKDALDVRRKAVDVLARNTAEECRLANAVGTYKAILVDLLK